MKFDPHLYILKGKTPVAVRNVLAWGRWFEKANRVVKQTLIHDVQISTVFLGVNHNFVGGGDPLLFETMIFGGEHDEYQERCATWEQAEEMHKQTVMMVRRSFLKIVGK